MEFLNRIEIVGVVGRINRRNISDRMVANFSVVTEYSYKDKSGNAVVETTWHNVVAWQNGTMPLDLIESGTHVCVQGRLRCRRYTGENGEPKVSYEVIAVDVNLL